MEDLGFMGLTQHHDLNLIASSDTFDHSKRKRHAYSVTIGARGYTPDTLAVLKDRLAPSGIRV